MTNKPTIDTHGLKMERLDIVSQKSDVLHGQGAYGNHYFQIFYDTVTGQVSYEEHIGNGYAPTAPDEICAGFIRRKVTKQELADMIWNALREADV